jgi:hypothetical protein
MYSSKGWDVRIKSGKLKKNQTPAMEFEMKKIIGCASLAVLALFLLIQLVPYGRNHRNPPVQQEMTWNSSEAEAIARRACFDCHSNETVWPFYSNIAPLSWLVQRDVLEGRQVLNFSEVGRGESETEEIAEVVQEGEMPPLQYILLHPSARLTRVEKATLIQGFGGGEIELEENEEGETD